MKIQLLLFGVTFFKICHEEGRSTRDASRKRLCLNDEIEEERETRLYNSRESNNLNRNKETSVERKVSLNGDRIRHISPRARESSANLNRS